MDEEFVEEQFSRWMKSVDGITTMVQAAELNELTVALRRAFEAGYQTATKAAYGDDPRRP
jgi:hypothetical protein